MIKKILIILILLYVLMAVFNGNASSFLKGGGEGILNLAENTLNSVYNQLTDLISQIESQVGVKLFQF